MASLGDVYENRVLDAILGSGRASNMPEVVYVALFTSPPGDTGSGTEVSGNAYERVAVANESANWPAATGGAKKNGSIITFPTATGAWGTVGWVAIMDALSGGNVLLWGELTAAITPVAGNTPFFDVNSITIGAD